MWSNRLDYSVSVSCSSKNSSNATHLSDTKQSSDEMKPKRSCSALDFISFRPPFASSFLRDWLCVLKTVCSHSLRVAPDSRQISVPTLLLKGEVVPNRIAFQIERVCEEEVRSKEQEWVGERLISILGNGTTGQTTGDCSIGKLRVRNCSAGERKYALCFTFPPSGCHKEDRARLGHTHPCEEDTQRDSSTQTHQTWGILLALQVLFPCESYSKFYMNYIKIIISVSK